MKNNKFFIATVTTFVGVLCIGSGLVASESYFNNKEINNLTTQCLQNGGESVLEIYNDLTHEYSFECK